MADRDINLMPENLRHKEEELLAKAKEKPSAPDLNLPAKESLAKPKIQAKIIEESKHTLPAFFTKIGELFRKKAKPLAKNLPLTDLAHKLKLPEEKEIETPIRIIDKPPILPEPPVLEKPIIVPPLTLKPPVGQVAEIDKKSKDKFHQPEKIIRAKFLEDSLGVNLVPTSSRLKSWKQITTLIIVTLVSSLAIVAVFYFGLLMMDKSLAVNRSSTMKKIAEIETKLLEFEDVNKEINKKGKEISLIYDVLNKHIYWTNLFKLLEKYTTPDVYYTGISAGNNGAIVLQAVAVDYAAVGRQLKILQQEETKEFAIEAEITSATKSENGVGFAITLILNPDLFYYNSNL